MPRSSTIGPWLLLPVLALVWVGLAAGVELRPLTAALTAVGLTLLTLEALSRGLRWSSVQTVGTLLLGWVVIAAILRPVSAGAAASVVAAGAVALVLVGLAATARGAPWARIAVILAGAASGVWLIVQRFAAESRPIGPLGSPNLSATVALLGLALAPAGTLGRAPTIACALASGAGIVSSGSRGALLGGVAVAMAWALNGQGKGRRRVAALALAVTAAIGIAARVWADRDPLRYERVRIWAVAARVFVAELPFGAGPAGYTDVAVAHNFPRDGEFARYSRIPSLAESDALQLAATLGLPGILLGGVLAWRCLARLGRGGPAAWGVAAAILSTSAVNTQLSVPVVGWTAALAIGSTLRRERGRRLRVTPASALPYAALAATVTAVALVRPAGWLGSADPASARKVAAFVRDQQGDDAHLADLEAIATHACAETPRAASSWSTLGQIRLRRAYLRGEPALAEAAARAFEQARRENHLDAFGALGEAQARRWLGDRGGALRAAQAAVALEPNFVGAWLLEAALALEAGDIAGARQDLGCAETAMARARPQTFVSEYERALASADPLLLRRVRDALGVSR